MVKVELTERERDLMISAVTHMINYECGWGQPVSAEVRGALSKLCQAETVREAPVPAKFDGHGFGSNDAGDGRNQGGMPCDD